jgi:TolA-binding protein
MGQARALEALGDVREAARAYLAVYSGYPDSAIAPEALTKLGVSLGALGKVAEACVTLSEVGARYPGSDMVLEAQSAGRNLGCS